MVAPLGTNEIQTGGAPSAGLYNAIGRGVQLRIVADKGSLKVDGENARRVLRIGGFQ